MNQAAPWLRQFLARPMVRWWIVGLFFTGFNIPALYVLHEVLGLRVAIATLITAELITILRFFLNDRWVFGHPRPTWRRLWQYHISNASSFVIWWLAVNLIEAAGIHYLIASLLATAISVGWSMATNFLWIWRKKAQSQDESP